MSEGEMYSQAVELWGEASQRLMVVEECAELISSICREFRGRVSDDDVLGEAVDVQVVINQLRHMLNNDEEWNKKMRFKLERLERRIEGEQVTAVEQFSSIIEPDMDLLVGLGAPEKQKEKK